MCESLHCIFCGSMSHSSGNHSAVEAEERLNERIKLIANTIRIMAFSCKSLDVMSCEFGNEFGDRVEKYLNEQIKELNEN